MNKKSMKATDIKKLLSFLLVLIIAGTAGGFYYGLQQVKTFAVEVDHTVTDSNASGNKVEELRRLKSVLAEQEQLVAKANTLFSTGENYQSQAVKDVQKYASTFGLTISNTNFNPENAPPAVSGKTFAITVQSPVQYEKMLQFLDAIEGNLPKMQIASITIGRAEANGATNVTTSDITIMVSTR